MTDMEIPVSEKIGMYYEMRKSASRNLTIVATAERFKRLTYRRTKWLCILHPVTDGFGIQAFEVPENVFFVR